jgi:trypsin-like peptidase
MFSTLVKIIATLSTGIVIGILGWPLLENSNKAIAEVQSPIPKLYNIIPVAEGKFPAMVRLVDEQGRFFCSGTVVAENLVLTAAHCLKGGQLGIESLSVNGKRIVVPAMPIMANVRADYGLVTGNFSKFTQMKMMINPDKDILYFQSEFVACGNPWGSKPVCYPLTKPLRKFFDQFITEGQIYPGMSGGPVVDVKTGLIVAVNTGVTEDGVVISPLIGLFESIGR